MFDTNTDELKVKMDEMEQMCKKLTIPGPLDFLKYSDVIYNMVIIVYEDEILKIKEAFAFIEDEYERQDEIDNEIKKLIDNFKKTSKDSIEETIDDAKSAAAAVLSAAISIPKQIAMISIESPQPSFVGAGVPNFIKMVITTLIKISAIIESINLALKVARKLCMALFKLKIPMPPAINNTIEILIGSMESANKVIVDIDTTNAIEDSKKAIAEQEAKCKSLSRKLVMVEEIQADTLAPLNLFSDIPGDTYLIKANTLKSWISDCGNKVVELKDSLRDLLNIVDNIAVPNKIPATSIDVTNSIGDDDFVTRSDFNESILHKLICTNKINSSHNTEITTQKITR